MKKFLTILLAPVLMTACYMDPRVNCQFKRPYWEQSNPYGMNYIHFGPSQWTK